jgi:hypothetical protein
MFIEKDVWDVMINHFQTRVQIELDMEEEYDHALGCCKLDTIKEF